jgi:tetratricopeptide (TPR) repeat protein
VRTLLLASLLVTGTLGAYSDEIARGDAAWAGRARGAQEGRAQPGPVSEAVRAYERAFAAQPESLEACWKLLRGLYFAGYFAAADPAEARGRFERAREVSEDGIERLSSRLDSELHEVDADPAAAAERLRAASIEPSDVARLYFWAAVNWGAWSRKVGLLSAVGQGVADRLHRYTLTAVRLEPHYEDGGPLRLLGRLHAELPRVPLISGWVDQTQALPLVQRAYDLAPDVPGNQLLLALTLLDLAPARRDQALALLDRVAALTPRAEFQIEDHAVREEARRVLAKSAAAGRSS